MGWSASYTQYSQPATAGGVIGYDGVNRLTSISDTGGWSRSWAYDQWGNMAISGNTGAQTLDVNAPQGTDPTQIYNANNQRSDAGLGYDAAGNLNAMNGFTGNSIVYDAENRLLGAGRTGAGAFAYSYDGNGRRVSKTSSANTTVYVYDAQGGLAAEYNSAGWAAPPCTTCYLSYDHLGSVRMVTDSGGNVISRHDFFPFGEEITNSSLRPASLGFAGTDEVSQRFTGKERDTESGLDYFGARYYGSGMGRWVSPDPSNLSGRVHAETDSDEFVSKNLGDARSIQADWVAAGHAGIAPRALTAFGNALHTITDKTSPSHQDFQPWYGTGLFDLPEAAYHFVREAWPWGGNQERRQNAVNAAQLYFFLTFGSDSAAQAEKPKKPNVSSKVCYQTDNGRDCTN